ncbi:hypothetical protein ACFL5H_04310, partial [Candidatus Latescibacterota bacterium]
KIIDSGLLHTTAIPLPDARSLQEMVNDRTQGEPGKDILELSIQTRRGTAADWSKRIKVYMTPVNPAGEYALLGISRAD